MSIFILDGKTFIKDYINEDPEKVLSTQFVLVSQSIRSIKNSKYQKQILAMTDALYPTTELIHDYDDYKENREYSNAYFEQLEEHLPFFATIIEYVIKDNVTVVFLCAEREKKYHFLKLIKEFIEARFEFPVYDYKKLKKGKASEYEYDKDHTLKKCKKILKKAKLEKMETALSSEKGREKYFDSMSKKELKKELKKRNLYEEGMDKHEMIDMLSTFA